MTPQADPRRVRALFDAVVDLPPDERRQYLDQHCPEPPVRQMLERLLAADAIVHQPSSPDPACHFPPPCPDGERVPDTVDPPESQRAPLPSHIGRYRVVRTLGEGGFGIVYLAHDEQLDRPVAIKVPHPSLISRPEDAEPYLTEARTVAGLDHPNIVPVYDVGSTEDWPCFVVSKFIEGSTLSRKIKEDRPSLAEAVELVATVAETLHYAHRKGLVHRDIKPGNILLDASGQPYVADFGLALQEEHVGHGPTFAGTPAYMSPEQARREGHRVDGRSDIFSLGVVFYQLLTGRRPFHADSREELLEQIRSREVRPPRQWDDAIPKELERICLKTLAKRASERYTTARDLADDLWHFHEQSSEAEQHALRSHIPAASTPSSTPASTPVPSPVPTPPSDQEPVKIVPKGLRSFDAHDADFFLALLPGPRDREGLPDSLRFWKTRIEETDPDHTVAVGLLYGPSGCGKSSLVKAGLLPRLARQVLAVYVEATAAETEARLLKGLRKHCPELPADAGLVEALSALRRGRGLPPGQKLLLVLDQFEQWLHANRAEEGAELVQALRQCDGGGVQCVVLVRDDFWMATTRFMQALEVQLVEGHNSAAVDLFDPRHARKVLAAFGRAFAALPERPGELSREQEAFLDQAVAGLAQEGKVISVRLALFAEMVKGKPWAPATLESVGGAEGVGVTFLEETFSAATAPPEHRLRQRAARAVLKALLPEQGSDIKGSMRPYVELLAASGLAARPRDFDALLSILDGELRLITPTDPEGAEDSSRSPGDRYYQLTHDYLVPSLRGWLTRKQKETRRGRAELRLAERAALWISKPERRHLPAWWEWLTIRLFTRPKDWTAPQRKMMRQAGRFLAVRSALLAAFLVLLLLVGWEGFGRVRAQALMGEMLSASTENVLPIVEKMAAYRRWLDEPLRQAHAEAKATGDARKQLNTSLALLLVDPGQRDYLCDRLLDAEPHEVGVLRGALAPHGEALRQRLWAVVERPPVGKESRRLRAASALAVYDPEADAWDRVRDAVAADLTAVPAVHLAHWLEVLRPVRDRLLRPLAAIYRDPGRHEIERSLVTDLLADYAADRPEVLTGLLMDADERQWAKLWPKLQPHRQRAAPLFAQELDKTLTPAWEDVLLHPSWGHPGAELARQVEAAVGLIADRFALCQTLPLEQFDAVAEALRRSGYRPVRFRPYAAGGEHQPPGQDRPQRADAPRSSVLVAAVWARDGQQARWAHGLTADEATRRDDELRPLRPLDVTGYLVEVDGRTEARYAVLWGPPDADAEDVKMYAGVPADRHRAAIEPLWGGGYVPRSQAPLRLGEAALYSAVWVKPKRTLEIKEHSFSWTEAEYDRTWTPSHLQTELRLVGYPERTRDLGIASLSVPVAGLAGVPWGPLVLARAEAEQGLPGVDFAAAWINSATHVSEAVHGLDPAAHRARCRELAAEGYRPVALTVLTLPAGRGRQPPGAATLLAGSVWHRPVVREAAKDALAKRQAQAAVALLRLGTAERVWPLFEHRADPRLRSFLIHRLAPLATDPHLLLGRLEEEREVSRRRALVLALGGWPVERLELAARAKWLGRLRQWYRDEPDAGLHGAVEWLLRRWGDGTAVAQLEKELTSRDREMAGPGRVPPGGRQWYVNSQGQTMVILPESGPFWMGSPGHEAGRAEIIEPLHRVRIPRSFVIAAKEVTVEQFRRTPFGRGHRFVHRYSPRLDGPMVNVSWYDAARYCNWLSEQEGIPREEWCYRPNARGEYGPGMRLAPGCLTKRGYRLPTEAEWEYACRAGTSTRRYYGNSDDLLGEYAWDSRTTGDATTRPVGLTKPNELGLFDLLGNVLEWTQDPGSPYRTPGRKTWKEDVGYEGSHLEINNDLLRSLRGGAFVSYDLVVRSADRVWLGPAGRHVFIGLRPVRTFR
jgi:serine/threonine protein kinase/formylglycine-generating enzyme required for sulfatase activity